MRATRKARSVSPAVSGGSKRRSPYRAVLKGARRIIRIRDTLFSQRGAGFFRDSAARVLGEVRLFLTNPDTGQSLAALTVTGLDGRWSESVFLDYSAD